MKRLFLFTVLGGLIISAVLSIAHAKTASLYDCYQSQGEKWGTVFERAPKAAQYGIWQYKGTAEQNNLLAQRMCNLDQNGEKLLGTGFSVATGYEKNLRTSMSSAQDYVPVTSFLLKDNTTLSISDLGNKIFLTLEPGATREEIVMCTTQDLVGIDWETCTRGLAFSGTSTTAVAANKKTHAAGSKVVMSNVHYIYEQFVDTNSKTQTISGQKTFDTLPYLPTSTPTDNRQAVSTYQLQQATSTGGIIATSDLKGVVELITGTELGDGVSWIGGSGATLVLPNERAADESGGPGGKQIPVSKSATGMLDSSWGGSANTLATLNSSALVVQNPANATSTPTASKLPIAYSTGKIDEGWITGSSWESFVAGEAIDTSAAPLAVYLNSADGRVYKTASGVATTTFPFIGFATQGQSISLGGNINIKKEGLVYSFTGLTTGSVYFISTAGTVSTTVGTVSYKIGRAVNSTTLLIEKGKKIVAGNTTAAYVNIGGTTQSTTTIYTGFYPDIIKVYGLCGIDSDGTYPFSYNIYSGGGSSLDSLGGNEAQWVGGSTKGFQIDRSTSGSSVDTTYLINFYTGALYSRILVGSVDKEKVNFLNQFNLVGAPGTDDSGKCTYNYIIE